MIAGDLSHGQGLRESSQRIGWGRIPFFFPSGSWFTCRHPCWCQHQREGVFWPIPASCCHLTWVSHAGTTARQRGTRQRAKRSMSRTRLAPGTATSSARKKTEQGSLDSNFSREALKQRSSRDDRSSGRQRHSVETVYAITTSPTMPDFPTAIFTVLSAPLKSISAVDRDRRDMACCMMALRRRGCKLLFGQHLQNPKLSQPQGAKALFPILGKGPYQCRDLCGGDIHTGVISGHTHGQVSA